VSVADLPPPRDAWPHLVRAVHWAPVVGTSIAAAAIALWARIDDPTARQAIALAVLAGGAAFLFDDAAANVLASSPSSLWRRRVMRLWLGIPLLGLGAVPVLAALASRPGALSTWDAVLELVVWVCVVVVAAAALGGAAVAPCQLVFASVAVAAPSRWHLYPVEPHRLRWLVVAVAGVVTLRYLSRDPVPE
jgi:hypothetical protein